VTNRLTRNVRRGPCTPRHRWVALFRTFSCWGFVRGVAGVGECRRCLVVRLMDLQVRKRSSRTVFRKMNRSVPAQTVLYTVCRDYYLWSRLVKDNSIFSYSLNHNQFTVHCSAEVWYTEIKHRSEGRRERRSTGTPPPSPDYRASALSIEYGWETSLSAVAICQYGWENHEKRTQ